MICEQYGFIHFKTQGLQWSSVVDDTAIQYGTYPDLVKVLPTPHRAIS